MGKKELILNTVKYFLNIFELKIDNTNNNYNKLKIYNKNNEQIGLLTFENGNATMYANSSDGIIYASYNLLNEKNKNNDISLISLIKFRVKSKKTSFSGEMTLNFLVNDEFSMEPDISLELDFYKTIKKCIIKINRDGNDYFYQEKSDNYLDQIEINCNDLEKGFIKHQLRNGKYEPGKSGYNYLRYYAIVPSENDKEKIILHSYTKSYSEILSYYDGQVLANGLLGSNESIIQKGKLMQQINSDFLITTKKVKDILSNEDVSIFENFINFCFLNYNEEVIKSLFGIERNKENYKKAMEDYMNFYYIIYSNKDSLLEDVEKTLLKK